MTGRKSSRKDENVSHRGAGEYHRGLASHAYFAKRYHDPETGEIATLCARRSMQVALREVLLIVRVYRGRTQSRKFPATEPRPLATTLGLNRELSRELVVLEDNPEVLRVSRRSPRRMSEESTTQRWISGIAISVSSTFRSRLTSREMRG